MAPRRDDSHPEEAEENRRRSSTPLRRSVRVLQGLTDSQRRVIREKQRQVHDHLVNEDYDDLGEVRDENNELFDNVKWTRELVLDADNIDVLATKYAKEVEQNVQVRALE